MTFICALGDNRSCPPAHPCSKEFPTFEDLMDHIYSSHIKVVKVYGKESK